MNEKHLAKVLAHKAAQAERGMMLVRNRMEQLLSEYTSAEFPFQYKPNQPLTPQELQAADEYLAGTPYASWSGLIESCGAQAEKEYHTGLLTGAAMQ